MKKKKNNYVFFVAIPLRLTLKADTISSSHRTKSLQAGGGST